MQHTNTAPAGNANGVWTHWFVTGERGCGTGACWVDPAAPAWMFWWARRFVLRGWAAQIYSKHMTSVFLIKGTSQVHEVKACLNKHIYSIWPLMFSPLYIFMNIQYLLSIKFGFQVYGTIVFCFTVTLRWHERSITSIYSPYNSRTSNLPFDAVMH